MHVYSVVLVKCFAKPHRTYELVIVSFFKYWAILPWSLCLLCHCKPHIWRNAMMLLRWEGIHRNLAQCVLWTLMSSKHVAAVWLRPNHAGPLILEYVLILNHLIINIIIIYFTYLAHENRIITWQLNKTGISRGPDNIVFSFSVLGYRI